MPENTSDPSDENEKIKREKMIDVLTRSFEHTKEMQIHIGSTRFKVIFGCGTFATALAALLMKEGYIIAALFIFNIMCSISIYVDKHFRNILFNWIERYGKEKNDIIKLIKSGKIKKTKNEKIHTGKNYKNTNTDFVSLSLICFYLFTAIATAFTAMTNESSYNYIRSSLASIFDLEVPAAKTNDP